MKTRNIAYAVLMGVTVIVASPASASPSEASAQVSKPQINPLTAILRDRIDRDRRALGMLVVQLGPDGSQVTTKGLACENGRAVDENTVFEIGSLTKPMTSALIHDMARRGELDLNAAIGPDLRAIGLVVGEDVGSITLQNLLDHTSGLPRMPADLTDDRDYNMERLKAFMQSYALPRAPGTQREYSNLGYGLLGLIAAHRAGRPYADLLSERIFSPLGMADTTAASVDRRDNEACGHDEALQPVSASQITPVLEAAGSVRSTARDMTRFLQASMDPTSPLRPVWGRMQAVRGRDLVVHDGSTAGFASYLGYDPERATGVVVLSNSRYLVNDIALHLLQPEYPVVRRRTAVGLSDRQLDRWVGTYQLDGGERVIVSRFADRLFLTRANQSARDLKAENESDFFLDDARPVTFALTGDGVRMTLQQRDGLTVVGVRESRDVSGGVANPPPHAIRALEGRYGFGESDVISVRATDNGLWARIDGQQELELLPLSEREYRYRDVDATIRFEPGAPAPSMEIVQGGEVTRANRIP